MKQLELGVPKPRARKDRSTDAQTRRLRAQARAFHETRIGRWIAYRQEQGEYRFIRDCPAELRREIARLLGGGE